MTAVPQISEAELTSAIVECAKFFGYRVAHFRPARTRHGWRTPMQGDVGFPDLVMAGFGRLIFVELKSGKGRVAVDQAQWLGLLRDAGCEVYVWRPDDWMAGDVERVLRGREW
jgi:hypothetical protein